LGHGPATSEHFEYYLHLEVWAECPSLSHECPLSWTDCTARWVSSSRGPVQRLNELQQIKSAKFDLAKLVKLCQELNLCYANDCFLAVAMLLRAILDHVPPIFSCKNFQDVCAQHGGKSFKGNMKHLEGSLRHIADQHLHVQIRSKETLPTRGQVNFSQDLDVLLAEIVRILK